MRPAARLFYARQKAELESPAAGRGGPAREPRPVPAAAADRPGPGYRRRQGPATRSARAARPRPGRPRRRLRRRFQSWCWRCPCSSCTRRIWARRSSSALWPPARPGVATSPPTGSSPPPTWPGNSAWSRCPFPRARRSSRPGPWPPCRSAARRAVGRGGLAIGDRRHDPGQGGTWLDSRYTALEALRDTVRRGLGGPGRLWANSLAVQDRCAGPAPERSSVAQETRGGWSPLARTGASTSPCWPVPSGQLRRRPSHTLTPLRNTGARRRTGISRPGERVGYHAQSLCRCSSAGRAAVL